MTGELELADELELRLHAQLFPVDLTDGAGVGRPEWKRLPVLHGRTADGTAITLVQCEGLILPMPQGADFGGRESYTARAALVGALLDDPPAFGAACIELDVLESWAEPPGIADIAGGWDELRLAPRRQVLETVDRDWGTLSLSSWAVGPVATNSISISQATAFDLQFHETVSMDDVLRHHARRLVDLMALLVAQPVRISSITLLPDPEGEGEVSLHLPLLQASDHRKREHARIPQEDMLSSRRHPLLPFPSLVECWLDTYDVLAPAIAMLLLPERSPFIYEESRFLAAFWSAEVLHPHRFDKWEIPKDELKKRVDKIKAALGDAGLDTDLVEWATNGLSRNDRTLRHKLDDLIGWSGDVGRAIVEQQPKFVSNLTQTRGRLAHSGSGGAVEGVERYFHAEALRWILRTCLLRELGADETSVQKAVFRNQRFRRVLRHLGEEPQEDSSDDDAE